MEMEHGEFLAFLKTSSLLRIESSQFFPYAARNSLSMKLPLTYLLQ